MKNYNDQIDRTSSVEVTTNKIYIFPQFTIFASSNKQIVKYGKGGLSSE